MEKKIIRPTGTSIGHETNSVKPGGNTAVKPTPSKPASKPSKTK